MYELFVNLIDEYMDGSPDEPSLLEGACALWLVLDRPNEDTVKSAFLDSFEKHEFRR